MIVIPQNKDQWMTMAMFLLEYAGVQPSNDLRLVAWVAEGHIQIVIGFNGFIGSVSQIHMAFGRNWHFTPRSMLREVFRYAFNDAKRDMLLGIVNSKNEKAMRMDLHLGFTELYRLPGKHDDGGDIVLLGMTRAQCRYLEDEQTETPQMAEAGHA